MLFGSAKFTPSVLRKWQAKQPKAAKLLQFWPNMNEQEKADVTRLADVAKWPQAYLAQLPDAEAAEAFTALWPQLPAALQEALLKSLIAMLLEKTAPKQEAAVNLLLKLADDRMISPLIVATLKDESYDVALVSRVLAQFTEKAGRILAMVYSGLNSAEKKRILQLIGQLKPATATEILQFAILEPEAELRILAAKTCAQVTPPDLLNFLAPLVQDEENGVRAAACGTLGRCGGTAAVPILQAAFDNDDAWTVKSMCASFLSKWEEQLAEQIMLDEGEMHAGLVEKIQSEQINSAEIDTERIDA